ncbi:MAG: ABC transporter permease, partial [Chitinophagaceae bacterium]
VYILQEKNVNAGLKNVSSQYLLKSKWKVKNMGLDITTVAPLPKALHETYPSLVSNYFRFNPVTNVVSAGNNHFNEDIVIGDTTLVSMYDFPVLHGNKNRAFTDINSAVITESMAIKLFGQSNAVDKRLSLQTVLNGEKQEYLVSAVLRDLPKNSVTGLIGDNYTVFVPTAGSRYYPGGDPAVAWNAIFEVGFIELKDGVTPADVAAPIKALLRKNAPENISQNLEVELVAVRDYYQQANEGAVNKMIRTLAVIGGFILIMAVINFVNISIGTSAYRLKEIGLRKVLGGQKKQLVFQFIAESVLLTLVAGIISLLCYTLLRPVFNEVLNTSIDSIGEFNPSRFLFIAGFILLIGVMAGLYPAFILSSSNIAFSVKGKPSAVNGSSLLRKSLLVVQFSLTIIVFIGALNVSRQVSHVFGKDLGYNKEQLMVITALPKQWDTTGLARMEHVKQRLLEVPVVKNATIAFEIPDRKPPSTIAVLPATGSENQPINISVLNADEDYAATYQLKMKSGNFFQDENETFIPGRIVLNESAAKALGIDPGSAVGQQVRLPAGAGQALTIAGVVSDYNYSNVQEGIEPLIFTQVKDFISYRFVTLKLQAADMHKAIAAVNEKWSAVSPNAPFEYFFMDEKFETLYRSELQLSKAATVATWLNLLIVLLGVFGVVAFTLQKRNKEIAIRKVLGADAGGIIRLFLKEYGTTIVLANIIAWPVAYFIVNNWLEHYTYRIQQNLVSYLVVGLAVFCFAFVMIIVQCFKIAITNPVHSLRTE